MLHAATASVQPPAAARNAGVRVPPMSLLPLVLVVLLGHALLLELLQPPGAVVGAAHLGSRPLRAVSVVALALPTPPSAGLASSDVGAAAAPLATRQSPAPVGADTVGLALPRRRAHAAADPPGAAPPPAQRRVVAADALPTAAPGAPASGDDNAGDAAAPVAGVGNAAPVFADTAAAADAGDADGSSAGAVAASVPVYPTQLPAAAELHFDVVRGAARGRAALRWLPGPAGYVLTLQGDASPALRWLDWRSQGGVDAAGIAPERYADRRRGRDLRAANFQRDKGLLTYSGPAVEQALPPGAQDRLSWMLQLTAVVQADPARAAPGARTTLFVTGARGDADVWTFVVEGVEAIDTGTGRVGGALHLRRLPRRPYDTLVDVWLDPGRSHLPARLRLETQQSTAAAVEFVLRDVGVP